MGPKPMTDLDNLLFVVVSVLLISSPVLQDDVLSSDGSATSKSSGPIRLFFVCLAKLISRKKCIVCVPAKKCLICFHGNSLKNTK